MTLPGHGISFVLPMFNEADNIRETITRISKLASEMCANYEIIVSDDASTDPGPDIVKQISQDDPHVRLIKLEKNSKFGGALNSGLMAATKDIVVYTDSDFPAKEEDIRRAVDALDGADIVTAYSLVIKDASFKRILMSKGYNFLVQALFGFSLRDINSGLKIYRRKILEGMKLKSQSPFIDVEIFAEALKKGAKIRQHGLIFELRTKGSSHISRLDVVARTFWDMLAYRLSR